MRTWSLAALVLAGACAAPTSDRVSDSSNTPRQVSSGPRDWRRGATCYEVFVRSFYDSNGDGIGDLRGLTSTLDYINDGNPATTSDLGAKCIWLMPVMESPSYHGYDATNYYQVEPDYGTNDDFKAFAKAAHERGIAVLVDMVLNHLSSEHPYFTSALGGATSPYRGWFRFSTTKPAEPGPWGQEVWHRSPARDEYYYGVFWKGMPDLNYDTPAVREEAKKIATFWLTQMGADGFRLDAVPYLVEEGSRQIGTQGTHAFLREYAAHVKSVAPNAFTVGEVWDGIDKMLPYYPDQLESYFAFDLSDSLIAAAKAGSAAPLMRQFARFEREVPNARWSTFLRNHDQTRTMTAIGGDVRRAKLGATLLLTLPGTPFVYYGEEIGMAGDKPDEQLRTPMQWSAAAGAGFTRGAPWESLQADWTTTNVASQDKDPASLLNTYRRLIQLRSTNAALGAGDFAALTASNSSVAAYVRRSGDDVALVVANLGTSAATGVTLTAPASTLPAGRYDVASLVGAQTGAQLTVAADGSISAYTPLGTLPPLERFVFAVTRIR